MYAKRKFGATSQAQEIVNVAITQSYYSDERQAQYDRQYATTGEGAPANHFSPVSLSVRATPSVNFNATFRAEFDSRYHELRTMNVQGTHNWTGRIQSTVGWSQRYYIQDLPGFNDPASLDHYLNASTNAHTLDNRFGAILFIQLQHPAVGDAPAAYPGFLQRPVLRPRVRVSAVQLRQPVPPSTPTVASFCRSRSPASGIFRRSAAR